MSSEATRLQYLVDDLRRALRRAPRVPLPPETASLVALIDERLRDVSATLVPLEAEGRLGRLALELARLFAAQSAPRDFCSAALEAIGHAMKAAHGYVVAFGGEEQAEAVVLAERGEPRDAQGRPSLSRSVLAEVVARRESVLVNDARDSPLREETSVVALDLRSVLATPLLLDGRVGGAIYLENASRVDAFGESDRLLLESIAQILAPYIQVGRRLDAAIEERARLTAVLEGSSHHRDIIGKSAAIRGVLSVVERLRNADVPVFIEGESGTGKELVARALHFSGRRASGPLVAVNCAAIPENLIESELFGHEKGAFSGAIERTRGRFEQASGGTLFLDEISELRASSQAKLLRVLQEQTFLRVGGSEPVQVDVRLIAATNRDLKQQVAEGKFREDLFYRLYVVPISVPPLRSRREDVPLLLRHFVEEFRRTTGKSIHLDPDVVAALEQYPFPGNVRELRNLVHRMGALASAERITAAELPAYVTGEKVMSLEKDPFRRFLREEPRTNEELKQARLTMQALFDGYIRRLEANFLRSLLAETGGNVSEAARRAGINRTLLHRKLKEAEEP